MSAQSGSSGGARRDAAALDGPALAAKVAGVDTARLDDHDLLDHVAEVERLVSWATERQLAAVADFARRPLRVQRPGEDLAAVSAGWAPIGRVVREFADDELAVQLKVSAADPGARIGLGAALAGLPATRGALSAGRIDVRRARVLVEETAALDRATAQAVETALMPDAERLAAARLKPKVRKAVVDHDPAAARGRAARARAARRVVITPVADGMAELWALLPAVEATAIGTVLTAAARASRAAAARQAEAVGVRVDERSMDQRRADALAAPFLAALATGALADGSVGGQRLERHRGRVAELQVTVAASTLLGRDDGAAMLHGYGVITAEVVRELAPDARWRRIVTDPLSGTVLDVGTTVYRPPAGLLRHVQVRDQRCTFPGCGVAAERAEFDHTVPFPHGSTSAANGAMRCKRHHRLKHSGAASVEQSGDGGTRWTMPAGHVHDSHPPAVGPVIDSPPPEPDP